MFAGLPPARPDDAALRAAARAQRAAAGLLLGVLDDDPTGSQAVHGIEVATVLDPAVYEAALDGGSAAGACFVLTNTRSLAEPDAARLTTAVARDLIAAAQRRGQRIQLISRSDSTLRGHLLAEVTAIQQARQDVLGRGFDGVLLIPAFLEAGRVTAGGIHWARIGPDLVPVGETEFARDPAFGYQASALAGFIAERSHGAVRPDQVTSIGLADIRLGGPDRVAGILAGVPSGGWVAVDAAEYSDLDTVAAGVLRAEQAGQSFLFRTGPSFVRALLGQDPQPPLRGARIWPPGQRRPDGGHGLIVVGSHVGQTSRQLARLRARPGVAAIELDVPALIHSAGCRPPARESYSLHFILEETVAVTSLLASDVHKDFPSLKLIVSHGGGAIPYQAGRFMPATARNPDGRSFHDKLRTLWYDTCLYTRDAIELLIRTVGVDRCLFGSEKPGTGSVRDPQTGRWYDDIRLLIDEIDWLAEADRSALFEGNAAAMFGLAPQQAPARPQKV